MKLCLTALSVFFVCLTLAVSAQAQSVQIGYVNMKQVLDIAPQVMAGREKLDLEFRPRNEEIEAEEAQMQALEQTPFQRRPG